MFVQFMENKYVKYSFIDNGILLTTDEIKKDGFREIWRQQSNDHSIQILCHNENLNKFQAYDRFRWMNEPVYNAIIGEYQYKKDLWTPIILHCSDCNEKPYIFQTTNRRKLTKLLRKAENKR